MARLTIERAHPGMRVAYVPHHAAWNPSAIEYGTVSSVNQRFVFVKFDKQTARLGFAATTAQACDPNDLEEMP